MFNRNAKEVVNSLHVDIRKRRDLGSPFHIFSRSHVFDDHVGIDGFLPRVGGGEEAREKAEQTKGQGRSRAQRSKQVASCY